MPPKAVILVAPGFEEIELTTTFDVLVRCDVEVMLAGLKKGEIQGSRGLKIKVEKTLKDVKIEETDALILPGGSPGYLNLRKEEKVKELVKKANEFGRIVAAICGAPTVLADAGVLAGKQCTVYPGLEGELEKNGGKASREAVVRDGNIITSRGPGTAMLFAAAVAEALVGKEAAEKVLKEMVYCELPRSSVGFPARKC
jgi:4-methyl-5(b-hydroxyethyl)-thiazole monophosphate biosynthesis